MSRAWTAVNAKSRRLPFWLGAIGLILMLPGALWLGGSRARVDNEDAWIALQPLTRIPLDGIDKQGASETFTVPNSARWTRIRAAWGEPEFVISATDPAGWTVICLPSTPVRIELSDRSGRVVPLEPEFGPYGYSDLCAASSLRFHAAVGDVLTLRVAKVGAAALPAGSLIVVRDWWNTKDKLVGVSLDEEIKSVVKWLSIGGGLLIAFGAGVLVLRNLQVKLRSTSVPPG